MPAPTGPTNPEKIKLIAELREQGRAEVSDFLLAVADALEKPARIGAEVNIGKLGGYAKETILVPGKVLAGGILDKPVTVAAFSFSKEAADKIKKLGGKALTIQELVKKDPKGRGVRILGG